MLKPDLPETAARFTAWWNHQPTDRPLLSLYTHERRPDAPPLPPEPATLEDRWLNPVAVADRTAAWLRGSYFPGDSIPLYNPNLGPVITAALFDAQLEFDHHTSWCKPIYHSPDDWHTFLATPANFQNRYWQITEQITARCLEVAQGDFLVGITDLHGNYDIISALRGNEEICLDLLDAPDLVAQASLHAAAAFNQAFARQWKQISAVQKLASCWTPFLHAGPAFIPSCDFWCMVSPDMGRSLVLPSIIKEMELLERSIFHLDGPQALPHLSTLLAIPHLNAVQWVYGAGQGPASRWLDVYRRILAAGKSIQLIAETPEDALTCLRALGSRNIWFHLGYSFDTLAHANAYLADFTRLAKTL